ncbi:MAG TPA: DUF4190 domain-containing protein [Streptosporangiaceae bacterium]|jgi:hypothetical protein|nr:DUF4190 domain-containing protein [Streptosporangiaceae bacterium]
MSSQTSGGSSSEQPGPGQPGQFPQAQFPQAQFPQAQFPQAQMPPGQYSSGPFVPGPYSAGQGPFGQYSYPPQDGYPPQYGTPAAPRTNRPAIWALVCGIGQFILGLTLVGNILAAIPAIILGAIALKQIRLRGEGGRGLAIAGLVLGILGVCYFLLIIALIVIGASVHSGTR